MSPSEIEIFNVLIHYILNSNFQSNLHNDSTTRSMYLSCQNETMRLIDRIENSNWWEMMTIPSDNIGIWYLLYRELLNWPPPTDSDKGSNFYKPCMVVLHLDTNASSPNAIFHENDFVWGIGLWTSLNINIFIQFHQILHTQSD